LAHLRGPALKLFIVRQHEAITDWLASRDLVDPEGIVFEGQGLGGKTPRRVRALVEIRRCRPATIRTDFPETP
jgi:hypothetical protein